MEKKQKIAIILFNLGAPDCMQAVRPFLFNLFFDKQILRVILPVRFFLAVFISRKREKTSSEIYQIMGGKSPLLENTLKQAKALEKELQPQGNFKCFVAMRYWHPMANETAKNVQKWDPDKIILFPLYPQFSTTTTKSSFKEWDLVAAKIHLKKPTYKICCYPTNIGFITSIVKLLENTLKNIQDTEKWRILFTAHGLPEKIIVKDPYQWQIQETTKAIAGQVKNIPDWVTCYQSRVGPMQWIKPYTDDEIIRAGKENKSIILVPIAFVSEHSETLVELDHEYSELAKKNGVKNYIRVPTVSEDKKFILGLKAEIENILLNNEPLTCSIDEILCPKEFTDCLYQKIENV